ncbi:MAG TPA: hypothetical protein DCP92_07045 [Nitrospiraceae bacterium]|nr:hypothetical protein [Nitrospiraceae bacterium]
MHVPEVTKAEARFCYSLYGRFLIRKTPIDFHNNVGNLNFYLVKSFKGLANICNTGTYLQCCF